MRHFIARALFALGLTVGALTAPVFADSLCPINNGGSVANSGAFQLRCDANGYLEVDVVVGGGGGSLTLPYTAATASQSASTSTPSMFGVGSVDTAGYFEPLPSGNAGVSGSGRIGVPYFQGIGASGSVPSSQSGTWNVGVTSLPSLPAGSNAIGLVTIANTPLPTYTPSSSFSPTVAAQAVVAEPPNGATFPISAPTTLPVALPTDANGNALTSSQGLTPADVTGSLSSTGSVTLANANDFKGAFVQVTGTFVGTLTFNVTTNGGASHAIAAVPGGTATAIVPPSSITAPASLYFDITGASTFSVTATTYTSGTISVDIRPLNQSPAPSIAAFRGGYPGVNVCPSNAANLCRHRGAC